MTAPLPFSVAGKTILYSGAAGGLGLETTLNFLRAGAWVVAIDHDPKKIEELKSKAEAEGLNGLSIHALDLSDLQALRPALEAISREAGGFDVVM